MKRRQTNDQRVLMDAFLTLIYAVAILVTLDLAALTLGRDSREQRA